MKGQHALGAHQPQAPVPYLSAPQTRWLVAAARAAPLLTLPPGAAAARCGFPGLARPWRCCCLLLSLTQLMDVLVAYAFQLSRWERKALSGRALQQCRNEQKATLRVLEFLI